MKKKKFILNICLIVSVILIILIIILKLTTNKQNNNNISNNKQENNNQNTIENTNELVVSKQMVSNIVFSDIKYVYDGIKTTISMKVTNNNDKKIKLKNFIVAIYTENNEYVEEFNPYSNYIISPKDTHEITFSKAKNLIEAYSIKIELPELEFIEE